MKHWSQKLLHQLTCWSVDDLQRDLKMFLCPEEPNWAIVWTPGSAGLPPLVQPDQAALVQRLPQPALHPQVVVGEEPQRLRPGVVVMIREVCVVPGDEAVSRNLQDGQTRRPSAHQSVCVRVCVCVCVTWSQVCRAVSSIRAPVLGMYRWPNLVLVLRWDDRKLQSRWKHRRHWLSVQRSIQILIINVNISTSHTCRSGRRWNLGGASGSFLEACDQNI